MNKAMKIIIVVVLAAVVVAVVAVKQQGKSSGSESTVAASANTDAPAETTANIPRMIDLGAGKCIPCKMMKPILDELREEYKGRFEVIFIDVWENPNAGEKYGIRMIPTQVFYDGSGKELYRHEGFYSKEDILGKWKELGVNLEKGTNNETN